MSGERYTQPRNEDERRALWPILLLAAAECAWVIVLVLDGPRVAGGIALTLSLLWFTLRGLCRWAARRCDCALTEGRGYPLTGEADVRLTGSLYRDGGWA